MFIKTNDDIKEYCSLGLQELLKVVAFILARNKVKASFANVKCNYRDYEGLDITFKGIITGNALDEIKDFIIGRRQDNYDVLGEVEYGKNRTTIHINENDNYFLVDPLEDNMESYFHDCPEYHVFIYF